MKKPLLIILGLLLLICCCCSLVLGLGYVALRNGDINLNSQCYKGIDNVFANKPVPCGGVSQIITPTTPVVPPVTPQLPPVNANPETKLYSNSEYSFKYPQDWKLTTTDGGVVTVTTPEGDILAFNHSVEESGDLTSPTCKAFAEDILSSFQRDVDPEAKLINSQKTTVGAYGACVFDIDSTVGGVTSHLRYVYLVNGNKGYMIKLAANDNSTWMTEMLKVVETIVLM